MAERPEDLNLPLAVVQRLIKDSLPDQVNVSKEAKQTISRASSVFVLYLTACAATHANKAKRKTLAISDIMAALKDMEFDAFIKDLSDTLKMRKEVLQHANTNKPLVESSTDENFDSDNKKRKINEEIEIIE